MKKIKKGVEAVTAMIFVDVFAPFFIKKWHKAIDSK